VEPESSEVTLLPGDGIGPEVTEAKLRVVDELPVRFSWDRHRIIGKQAVKDRRLGDPKDVVTTIQNSFAIESAIEQIYGEGTQLRPDMDGECSTLEFAEHLASRIEVP